MQNINECLRKEPAMRFVNKIDILNSGLGQTNIPIYNPLIWRTSSRKILPHFE